VTTPVYSLSISAAAVLDLHSLNNEGGEGNQIQTRMVNIVGHDGRLANVNAISGDMWKHIQAEHLFFLATNGGELDLCAGCREFNANRASADPAYIASIEGQSDAASLDLLLQRCALDDLEGNLITSGKRSLPRKSVVEFGWVVARPEQVATDSYFHVKYASERSVAQRAADTSETARQANLGQAIFHRPASSGVYAIVANLEAARIGFNDISQRYAVDPPTRHRRYRALLESILYTFIAPKGAMRGTQNPHIVDVEGVIAVSRTVIPAPTISALNTDYRTQIGAIADALNGLRPESIELRPFASLAEFAREMTDLVVTTEPFTLRYEA